MNIVIRQSKFPLGQLVMTSGVAARLGEDGENPEFDRFVSKSILRHAQGDWGDICESDKRENNVSLLHNFRLFSSYEQEGVPKIWIITEADRSVTTVLFPDEY